METWRVDARFIEDWMDTLDDDTYAQVVMALRMLSEQGPHLGRPLVDSIKQSTIHNLKELRPGSSQNSKIRILFAFDPQRKAVMLFAGDKRRLWSRWYRKAIPLAEERYRDYLSQLAHNDEKGQ